MRRVVGLLVLVGCVDPHVSEHEVAIQSGAPVDRANVAALRYTGTFMGTPVDKVGCTATLIAPDVLLTAAHCIDPAITDMVGLPRVVFEADATTAGGLATRSALPHESFVYTAPFHIYLETPHDVGLLFLAQPVSVVPASIGRASPAMGESLDVVGYGQRVDGDDATLGLEYTTTMSITEIAATEVRAFGSGCVAVGDSGGPAFSGERIVGITSHSGGETFECVHGDIFERTDAYVDWIVKHAPSVCDHSEVDACGADPDPDPDSDGGCSSSGSTDVSGLVIIAFATAIARRRRRAQ
jgi:secreted trypsin-like serine protease